MNPYSIEPIGVIRSKLTSEGSAPRFHSEIDQSAVVELHPAHAGKLREIRAGDEILVVTMHPGRSDGAAGLGLHRTRVDGVDAGTLRVAGLAEIDGTAVVEISTSRAPRTAPRADPWKFTAPAWPSRYS